MDLIPILSVITGSSLVSGLIWIICIALVFWLLWFLIGYIALPQPFDKIIRVILMVVAVVVLINFILSIAGHPIIQW